MAIRYDVYTRIVPPDQLNGTKYISFGPTRSLGVRGLQKLLGVFTKYLLTPIGSDPLDPQGGTELTGLLGSNVDASDAREILNLSVNKCVSDVQAFQLNQGLESDERLASASVTQFIKLTDNNGFSAQILIRNAANESTVLLLPTLSAGA